jgi:hypothetical protein
VYLHSRPGEIAPGCWVGPGAGLDAVEKREILYCRILNPGRSARRYSDGAIPVLNIAVESKFITVTQIRFIKPRDQ